MLSVLKFPSLHFITSDISKTFPLLGCLLTHSSNQNHKKIFYVTRQEKYLNEWVKILRDLIRGLSMHILISWHKQETYNFQVNYALTISPITWCSKYKKQNCGKSLESWLNFGSGWNESKYSYFWTLFTSWQQKQMQS